MEETLPVVLSTLINKASSVLLLGIYIVPMLCVVKWVTLELILLQVGECILFDSCIDQRVAMINHFDLLIHTLVTTNGFPTRSTLINSTQCNGYESSLDECTLTTSSSPSSNCPPARIATVSCQLQQESYS